MPEFSLIIDHEFTRAYSLVHVENRVGIQIKNVATIINIDSGKLDIVCYAINVCNTTHLCITRR